MITTGTLDQIHAAPIETIISKFVEVRRGKALCPFHDDTRPSLSVRDNFFKCFVCDASGDAIGFLMQINPAYSFHDAVAVAAGTLGITVEETDEARQAPRLPKREALAAAQKLFHSNTHTAVDAWLAERSVTAQDMAPYGLGYATGNEVQELRKEFTDETLKAAGLLTAHGKAFFVGRLMFPIMDSNERVVAFGARKLFDRDPLDGKFVNSPAVTWDKSRTLYGLDKAQRAVRSTRSIILVEGYMDCYSMHTAGLLQTVSPCGTSITQAQVDRARQLVGPEGEIVVATDGDDAGRKVPNAMLDLTGGHRVSVMAMPSGMDPDDVRRQQGGQALLDLFEARVPLVQYLLDTALADDSTPETIAAGAQTARDVLSRVTDLVLREQHRQRLEAKLRVPLALTPTPAPTPTIAPDRRTQLESKVLRLAVSYPLEFERWKPVLAEQAWLPSEKVASIPAYSGQPESEWREMLADLGITQGCHLDDPFDAGYVLADSIEPRDPRYAGDELPSML